MNQPICCGSPSTPRSHRQASRGSILAVIGSPLLLVMLLSEIAGGASSAGSAGSPGSEWIAPGAAPDIQTLAPGPATGHAPRILIEVEPELAGDATLDEVSLPPPDRVPAPPPPYADSARARLSLTALTIAPLVPPPRRSPH